MKKQHKLLAVLSLSLLLITSCAKDRTIEPDPGIVAKNDLNQAGSGMIEYNAGELFENKIMDIWYYSPVDNPKDLPILFVMHGTGRNGKSYRDNWVRLAQENNLLLIVPEFSNENFPGSRSYNLGNLFDKNDKALPEEEWSFSLIEPIFDFIVEEVNSNQKSYNMYGHSAGSQFVSRYLTFKTDTRLNKAVCANAGWYTLLNEEVYFPYGLKSSPASKEHIEKILKDNVIILLGENDTDPNDSDLRNTPETLAQGPHRLARGLYFYEEVERFSAEQQLPFNWKLATVPGVAHSNAQMASAAMEFLKE